MSLRPLKSRLRASDIVRIALSTDFNQIGSLTALDEIYAVLECHGLHDSMRRVVGAALALSPGDARFTARERALSAPHRLMFASTPAQAPSSAPSGRRTVIRDRMRDLLFWR